jgi:hypothetical protein
MLSATMNSSAGVKKGRAHIFGAQRFCAKADCPLYQDAATSIEYTLLPV